MDTYKESHEMVLFGRDTFNITPRRARLEEGNDFPGVSEIEETDIDGNGKVSAATSTTVLIDDADMAEDANNPRNDPRSYEFPRINKSHQVNRSSEEGNVSEPSNCCGQNSAKYICCGVQVGFIGILIVVCTVLYLMR